MTKTPNNPHQNKDQDPQSPAFPESVNKPESTGREKTLNEMQTANKDRLEKTMESTMKEKIQQILELEKTAGKNPDRDQKVSLAKLQTEIVNNLAKLEAEEGFAALEGFTNEFSSFGKGGKRLRKGLVSSFTALRLFREIWSDAHLSTAEEDVDSKCDLVADKYNIQIKSSKKFSVILDRPTMVNKIDTEQATLQNYKAGQVATDKWGDKQESFFNLQLERISKALSDWDKLEALTGQPTYIELPWDITRKSDYDRLTELVAELQNTLQ